jgi:glycosyltransferase involved in cell wall biosynthesis
MDVSSPLISIIIPAYNAADFLPRTLESVLNQTYPHFEVWVIDDGSQDETAAIARSFGQRDARIRCLQQANQGVAVARNYGIAQAQGEWIAPIDADDIWYPHYLEKLVALEQSVSRPRPVGVIYAWSIDIDEADQPIGGFHAAKVVGNVYRTLVCHNFLGNASATLIARSALQKVGGYDATMRQQQAQGCEDWDLYLRLAAAYDFAVVPEFLVGYRKLAASMSGDGQTMARSQDILLQRVYQSHPTLPRWYGALSRSSFYLYLAHQSAAQGQADRTLAWVKQAIRADWFTPWLRPSTYRLLLDNLVLNRLLPGHSKQQMSIPPKRSAVIPLRIPVWKVWLKVTVVSLVHICLSAARHPPQPQCFSEVDY